MMLFMSDVTVLLLNLKFGFIYSNIVYGFWYWIMNATLWILLYTLFTCLVGLYFCFSNVLIRNSYQVLWSLSVKNDKMKVQQAILKTAVLLWGSLKQKRLDQTVIIRLLRVNMGILGQIATAVHMQQCGWLMMSELVGRAVYIQRRH